MTGQWRTIYVRRPATYITLLLLACLALTEVRAATRADDRLFALNAHRPAGQTPVTMLAARCDRLGHEECIAVLRRWRGRRKVNALVKDAVTFYLARELRIAGKREEAAALSSQLGFLLSWKHSRTDGEVLVLSADPVSGRISSADWLDLQPGATHRFTATVRSAVPGHAAIRLAAPWLARVCVDQQCHDVERREKSVFDQVEVPLALRAGVNEIALEFSSEITSVNFGARLTRLEGGALASAVAGEPAVYEIGSRELPRNSARPDGSLSSLLALESRSLDDALLVCHAAKAAGYAGEEDLQAEVSAQTPQTRAQWLLALDCLAGHKDQYKMVLSALENNPDDARIMVSAAAYRYRTGQRWQAWRILNGLCLPKGLDCLESETRVDAVLLLRELMRGFGLTLTAEKLLLDTLAAAGPMPALHGALAENLSEQERYGDVANLLAEYVKDWPGDYALAASYMFALEKVSRLKDQAVLVEHLVWLFPTNVYLGQTLASLYERLDEKARAGELYGALVAKAGHNPFLLRSAAGFHYAKGETERAVQLWERALALRPDDSTIKDLLEYLGGGQEGFGAFVVDEQEIRTLAAELPDDTEGMFVGVLDRTAVKLYANRAWVTRRTLAVKAVKTMGSRPYYYDFTYDSYFEEASVVRAVVLRTDGSVAAASDYGDVPLGDEAFNLYYDFRRMVVRFDKLEPGDIVVLAYEVETSASTLSIPFSGLVWLQEGYPKYNMNLTVSVPPDTELFHYVGRGTKAIRVDQEIDETDSGRTYGFSFGRLAPAPDEVYPPGRYETLAHVHFSTMEDWKQFSLWYSELLDEVRQIDGSMKELVRKTLAETSTRREATEALARYVADDIRYVGLEFGVHGLKPYSPTEVYGRRFGDCKDKSLLLVTLLEEAGIPANLVALMTFPYGHAKMYPGSPSLFDHAIVYLPEEDVFFDPTARFLGLGVLPWQDQGAQAVIVDSANPRHLALPVSPARDNLSRVSVTVADRETMAVEGEIQFTGVYAWRALEALQNRGSWENTVESHVSSILPVVDINELEDSTVYGDTPSVTVKFKGTWQPPGTAFKVLSEAGGFVSMVGLPSRELPMVFGFPYRGEYELNFGARLVQDMPDVDESHETGEARFRVSSRAIAGGGYQVSGFFEQIQRKVEAEHYQAYRTLLHRYQEVVNQLEGNLEP